MGASHTTNIFLPAGHWIGIPDNDNFKRLWKEIRTSFFPYIPWQPSPLPCPTSGRHRHRAAVRGKIPGLCFDCFGFKQYSFY